MAESESSSIQKANHIRDARGRTVTQLDPVALYLLHRQDSGIPHEVLRELTREIGIGKLSRSRVNLWGGVIAFLCALILVGNNVLQLIGGDIAFVEFVLRSLLYQGIWVTPYVFWIGARKSRFHRISKAMLRRLRCPHCGYDMRGLPTAPDDGTTICPECGCAWLLDHNG